MCIAIRCCYCVRLDTGCFILGAISFAFSVLLAMFSIILLSTGDWKQLPFIKDLPLITSGGENMLLASLTLFAILWMIASSLLVLGIRKRRPGLVLVFFSFGTLLTILGMISSLLELVNNNWTLAFVTMFVSMLHIHCLVVVYAAYEEIQNGIMFGRSIDDGLEDPIMEFGNDEQRQETTGDQDN